MPIKRFSPFKNEADRVQINGLIIENRLDRVRIYGSLDITLDQEGLEVVRKLMEVFSLTLLELTHTELPDKYSKLRSPDPGNR